MDEKENRIGRARNDGPSRELAELAGRMLEKVGGNEDGACLLVIAGTEERTCTFLHSKPASRLANAVFNACINDPDLLGLLYISLCSAKEHVARRDGTVGGNPSAPENGGGEP